MPNAPVESSNSASIYNVVSFFMKFLLATICALAASRAASTVIVLVPLTLAGLLVSSLVSN